MTVQEYMGDRIEATGRTLANFLESTPPERRGWVPEVEGAAGLRSILDQISECIHVNRMFAALLRGQTPDWVNPIAAPRPWDNDDDAGGFLVASTDDLAEAVRALADEDVTREYVTRRGPMPGANAIDLPYRNMQYHGGQINLIQLLYGDTEFHIAPPPKP